MFCPKCGGQNPENGKFCRSCGTDLGGVTTALSGRQTGLLQQPPLDKKGRPISFESAITKIFSGLAFLAVSIALAFSQMGRGWWFWMLIPAFGSLGSGVARYMQLRRMEKNQPAYQPTVQPAFGAVPPNSVLPPPQTEWVAPDSKYKTGDLVPPSVTENTTRHLGVDTEGQTMTLPKK